MPERPANPAARDRDDALIEAVARIVAAAALRKLAERRAATPSTTGRAQ